MAIDVERVIRAAVEAAFEEPSPQPHKKRRLSTGRALLLGAGLVTAGRLASRGAGVADRVRDGVTGLQDHLGVGNASDAEDLPDVGDALDPDVDEEELDDDYDDEEDEFDDEELDDEDEDEPEAEMDEEEPEAEVDDEEPEVEDEPDAEDEEPDAAAPKAPVRRSRGRA